MKNNKRFIPAIIILAAIVCFAAIQTSYPRLIHPATIDDVGYILQSEDMAFEVLLLEIEKEEDKEDIYVIKLGNGLNAPKRLTKSEYENLEISEDNIIISTVYVLEIYTNEVSSTSIYEMIQLRRYSVFNQSNFTEQEVKEARNLYLEFVNSSNIYNRKREIEFREDLEKICQHSNFLNMRITTDDIKNHINNEPFMHWS